MSVPTDWDCVAKACYDAHFERTLSRFEGWRANHVAWADLTAPSKEAWVGIAKSAVGAFVVDRLRSRKCRACGASG
jgi:hypothetical protein